MREKEGYRRRERGKRGVKKERERKGKRGRGRERG